MDFGRGLSYARQDPNWLVKTLLGSIIALVPILNFAATGYSLDVIRNVYQGRETPLPEWGDNFADRWIRGLIGTVIAFIYLLPMTVVACVMFAAGMGAAAQSEQAASAGPPALFLCLTPVVFVLAIVLGMMAMIAQARYAVTHQFGEAMRFREVVTEFRSGMGRWIGVILMALVVGLAFGFLAALTCGLGYLLIFYVILAQSHWVAQAYRQSTQGIEPATGTL